MIRFYNAKYFSRIDFQRVGTDSVIYFINRYFAAVRRVLSFIDIMKTIQFLRMKTVQLQNYVVGYAGYSRRNTYTRGEHHFAVVFHVADFQDGDIRMLHESVAQTQRQRRKVQIIVIYFAAVERIAHVLV